MRGGEISSNFLHLGLKFLLQIFIGPTLAYPFQNKTADGTGAILAGMGQVLAKTHE